MNLRSIVFRVCALALVVAFAPAGRTDEAEPIVQPISEVRLTNGVELQNATIVKFDREWVVLKTTGGTGPVNYAMIAEPLRTRLLAERDAEIAKKNAPVIVGVTETTKVTGRVYSGDGEHIYRFPGVQVGFIPRAFAIKKMNPTLGTHEPFDHYAVVTKADGRGEFIADVPRGEYVVYSTAVRHYANGNRVRYEWVMEATVGSEPLTLQLNDDVAKFGFDQPTPKKKG